jgi:hypothetical protein
LYAADFPEHGIKMLNTVGLEGYNRVPLTTCRKDISDLNHRVKFTDHGIRLQAFNLDEHDCPDHEAIKKGYPFRIVGSPVFYEPLAIAIEKNDKEFNDKLSEIVAAMKADGTLSKLSDKWFGVDYTKATN